MMNSEGLADRTVPAMTTEQAALYERIQAFSLDQPNASLSFSQRLTKENGWSLEYARQAIEEYKKFAFLAVAADHLVSPSEQVDQVWHLHLTYTRSYWEDFCAQVLQTPLHHEPTQGGQAEQQKFEDWYSKTLESYKRFFGQTPPAEIWATPEERFGRDLQVMRVNTKQNWIIPKLQMRKMATIGVAIVLASIVTGCYGESFASQIDPVSAILIAGLGIGAGLGLINFLIKTIGFFRTPPNKPKASRTSKRSNNTDGGSCSSGCGGGGTWVDFSDSTDSGSSCDSDGGSGGDGGGCGNSCGNSCGGGCGGGCGS